MSAAAGLLSGFHAVIAMTRNEPHWMLSDADANRYGQALSNALRHMPIKAAQKTIDYSALVLVAFAMETPRIAKSVQLARAGKPKPASPFTGTAQVFQFTPNPAQQAPPQAAPSTAKTESPSAAAAVGGLGASPPAPFPEGPPDGAGFGGDE